MNNYPCKECILCGNCSKICDKIITNVNGSVTANLFEFIFKERCCVDCGCKDGTSFVRHLQYIVCNRCNSIYIVSASGKKYEISRHFKYIYQPPFIIWYDTTFEEFLDEKYNIGENHDLPL
jgi:hypothetical protein